MALFNGLLQYLWKNSHADQEFIAHIPKGLEQALVQSEAESPIQEVAQRTGISAVKLTQFFEKFAQTDKVITLFSMGVNQSSRGVDKANSITNCHLLTGKIGKLGCSAIFHDRSAKCDGRA